MSKEGYLKASYDLIYLVYCIINQKIPDKKKVENMTLDGVYKVAENHKLTSAAAMALESVGIHEHSFTQSKGKAIRKNAALDLERAKLLSFLDKNNIWYIPLKGIIMQDYYPEYGMRQMSDNDILFDKKYREEVKEYFESQGYRVKEYKKRHHDVYLKEPVYNFEMHISLVGKHFSTMHYYYKNVKKRLIPNKTGSGCHFSNEDFYVYMIAHDFKHYSHSGTGLRSLLDIYVFLNKFSDTLDMKYIESELTKIGIDDFENELRALALDVFGKGIIDSNKEMLEYIILSGAYGSVENIVSDAKKSRDTSSKLKYIINRIFKPSSVLRLYYPLFYRYKILLPFLPLYRFIRMFTSSRKKVKKEIKALFGKK